MNDPTGADQPTPDPAAALRRRAERSTPRGADDVLARARAAALDRAPGLAPAPSRARRPRRVLAIAAVALVALAVAGAVVARRSADTDPTGPDGFCSVLARPAYPPRSVDADLLIYVEPNADQATVDTVRAELAADPEVVAVRYVGPDETYERFRDLFAGQPVMLDNVEAHELPTSFEVTYAPGSNPAEAARRWSHDPKVFEVRDLAAMPARVLDLLVWVGDRPPRPTGASAELGFQPSPDAWEEHAGDVRAVADPRVAAAIDELTVVVEQRGGAVDGDDSSYDRAEAATAVIAAAAARECGLTARSFFAPDGGTTTATTGAPDRASTTTAVPAFGN